MPFGGSEEFKMVEDDEDHIDLLQEKKKSKNLNEFYAAEEMDNLKSMLRQGLPVSHQKMQPSMC